MKVYPKGLGEHHTGDRTPRVQEPWNVSIRGLSKLPKDLDET